MKPRYLLQARTQRTRWATVVRLHVDPSDFLRCILPTSKRPKWCRVRKRMRSGLVTVAEFKYRQELPR